MTSTTVLVVVLEESVVGHLSRCALGSVEILCQSEVLSVSPQTKEISVSISRKNKFLSSSVKTTTQDGALLNHFPDLVMRSSNPGRSRQRVFGSGLNSSLGVRNSTCTGQSLGMTSVVQNTWGVGEHLKTRQNLSH